MRKDGTSEKILGGQRLSKLKSTFVSINARLCCLISNPSSQWLNPTPFFLLTVPVQHGSERALPDAVTQEVEASVTSELPPQTDMHF